MLQQLCVLTVLAGLAARTADGPVRIPFYANAIWISGSVNGHGPFHIMLDTAAAANVLNSSKIRETGLPVLHEVDQANAGSGDRTTHITILGAARIEFGGISLEVEQLAAAMSRSSRNWKNPVRTPPRFLGKSSKSSRTA